MFTGRSHFVSRGLCLGTVALGGPCRRGRLLLSCSNLSPSAAQVFPVCLAAGAHPWLHHAPHVTAQQALRPLVPDVAITPACFQLGPGGFPPRSGFSCFCLRMSTMPRHNRPHAPLLPTSPSPPACLQLGLVLSFSLLQCSQVFSGLPWHPELSAALSTLCLAPSTSFVITFIRQQLSKRSWIPANYTLLALNCARHR
jgi:hypothetical protein